ncbi:hypothetical protein PE067_04685 [Paracoccus sp. DMF-8]|uniref:hypothetical protein n=1 Tax=Paracoccus sp. DMF-8 TaxID=3019445 RepID=UPI0023E87841|nr:hypothetical protein [Paracoccus sp. DMF-8]MDF3605505.1 hypothetical protein [Paracoccus sp. DMF-8]
MGQDFPIVGFRQDRLGARLICLLDIIRLSRRFDVPARCLWLSQPDGPYPELTDPSAFFMPELVRDYIQVIRDHPDVVGRRALSSVAQVNTTEHFANALNRGEIFLSGTMIEATRFADETPEEVSAALHDIVANLPLAPRLRAALDRAKDAIEKLGRRDAAAIHVRRGDILDGVPWSYRSWQAKYVPDEFFRHFVAQHDGPVLAFSDTPAAVTHLARGDPRILPVDRLLADQGLTLPERDALELLLMSRCTVIAAPVSSAFSTAAAMIGRARVMPLPGGLGADTRVRAYQELLDRVMSAPDSFYAPGDLAQSMVFATQHAISSGRAPELLDRFRPAAGFLDRFPFVQYWLGMAAFSAGKRAQACKLAQKALDNPKLRNTERQSALQLMEMARLSRAGSRDDAALPKDDATFLTVAFTANGGPLMPLLSYKVLSRDGPASRALMFPTALVDLLATAPDPGVSTSMVDQRDKDARALPVWTFLSDWSELLDSNNLRDSLPRTPPVWQKTAIGADLLADYERRLADGEKPGALDDRSFQILGFCASKLGLHGKLRRAFQLLHWLEGLRPDDPLTRKRLADCCYRASNAKAGARWLDAALELAPDNALLHLSAVRRAIAVGDFRRARAHFGTAKSCWSGLDLLKNTHRDLRRAIRARDSA